MGVRIAIAIAILVVAGAIATMTVHPQRMAAALDSALLATELADYLVKKGLPFREAHHLVGQAVRLGPLDGLSLEALQQLSPAFEADVTRVWDFRAAVDRRSAFGGTAPESVQAQIAEARERMKDEG